MPIKITDDDIRVVSKEARAYYRAHCVGRGRGSVGSEQLEHPLYEEIKLWKESIHFPWKTYAEGAGKKTGNNLFEALIANFLSNTDEDNELLLEIFEKMGNPPVGGEIVYKHRKGVKILFVSLLSVLIIYKLLTY